MGFICAASGRSIIGYKAPLGLSMWMLQVPPPTRTKRFQVHLEHQISLTKGYGDFGHIF